MRRFLLAAVMALAGCRPTLDFTLPDLDGNGVTPLRQGDAGDVVWTVSEGARGDE